MSNDVIPAPTNAEPLKARSLDDLLDLLTAEELLELMLVDADKRDALVKNLTASIILRAAGLDAGALENDTNVE